ncbi:hypothetical protein BC834DRAFT_509596 [Gloeopeniophorella convolvens]|nr:hypothetical protein BC834DRAFT_509596 [Gloeopeniophorella convolvens]
MTFLAFVFFLSCFWSALHAVRHLLASRGKTPSLLPISFGARRRTSTTVTLKGLHLSIESTVFNSNHDALNLWLSRRRTARFRKSLQVLFDAGVAISLLGMVIALVLLAWTFVQLARSIMIDSAPQEEASLHTKRGVEGVYESPAPMTPSATEIPIQLLIPGVTLPLSHLPLLIGALLFSQAIHEGGHALCAALDDISLSSLGASFSLIIPAAFVAFPTHALAASTPRTRARIAASGPLLSLLLGIILVLPLERPFLLLGYSDVSEDGLLVTSVAIKSPLSLHLPQGSLLTALDDLPLAGTDKISWIDYLTKLSPPSPVESAWCANREWFLGHPYGCCALSPPAPGAEACFFLRSIDGDPHCIEAPKLLAPFDSDVISCTAGLCGDGQVCVRLREGEEFLRIKMKLSDLEDSHRLVLWRGGRDEVFRNVIITKWRPRLKIIPLWFPDIAARFMQYTQTLTISLFLFNVLPLSQLDGGVLLDAVLRHLGPRESVEADLEIGTRRILPHVGVRSGPLRTVASSLTAALLAGCTLLGIGNIVLEKYM